MYKAKRPIYFIVWKPKKTLVAFGESLTVHFNIADDITWQEHACVKSEPERVRGDTRHIS